MTTKTRIASIQQQLVELGPVLPGKISKQFNVCGKKTCRCKDKTNPIKHGPYFQLNYSIAGRTSSIFLKEDQLEKVQKKLEDYQTFKQLVAELVDAYVQLAKERKFKL